jgi:hypothetical protein
MAFCCKSGCIFPGCVAEPEIVLNVLSSTPAALSEPAPCRRSASEFSLRMHFGTATNLGLLDSKQFSDVIFIPIFIFSIILLSRCAEEYSPVKPPLCSNIKDFGNGATCVKPSTELSECGNSSDRACSVSEVCFDSALYIICRCEKNEDCDKFSDYINSSRKNSSLSMLTFECRDNFCEEMQGSDLSNPRPR